MDVGEMRRRALDVNTPIAESTRQVYARLARRLTRKGLDPEAYAAARGLAEGTYFDYRAAFQRDVAQRILGALEARDRAVRAGDRDAARAARAEAERLVLALRDAHPDRSRARFRAAAAPPPGEYRGPRSRGLSKRIGLARLARERPRWRAELVAVVYRIAGKEMAYAAATMALSGARPCELAAPLGALVAVNGERLVILIRGAKVGGQVGQPWRRWGIERVPADLSELFAGLRAVAARQGGEMELKLPSVRALRRALVAAARRLGLCGVSAYSLRHAVKNDLAASGLARAAIAQAMGHASTRTAGRYGWRRGGSAGGYRVTVEAARAPRTPNRSFSLRSSAPEPEPEPDLGSGPGM